VIGLPFNDLRCLGSITEVVAEQVANRDEVMPGNDTGERVAERLHDHVADHVFRGALLLVTRSRDLLVECGFCGT